MSVLTDAKRATREGRATTTGQAELATARERDKLADRRPRDRHGAELLADALDASETALAGSRCKLEPLEIASEVSLKIAKRYGWQVTRADVPVSLMVTTARRVIADMIGTSDKRTRSASPTVTLDAPTGDGASLSDALAEVAPGIVPDPSADDIADALDATDPERAAIIAALLDYRGSGAPTGGTVTLADMLDVSPATARKRAERGRASLAARVNGDPDKLAAMVRAVVRSLAATDPDALADMIARCLYSLMVPVSERVSHAEVAPEFRDAYRVATEPRETDGHEYPVTVSRFPVE